MHIPAPGSGRIPGVEMVTILVFFKFLGKGAWQATVYGATKLLTEHTLGCNGVNVASRKIQLWGCSQAWRRRKYQREVEYFHQVHLLRYQERSALKKRECQAELRSFPLKITSFFHHIKEHQEVNNASRHILFSSAAGRKNWDLIFFIRRSFPS